MATIAATATAVPPRVVEQRELMARAEELLAVTPAALPRLRAALERAGVRQRHSVVGLDELSHRPGLTARTAAYAKHAVDLAEAAARRCLDRAQTAPAEVSVVVTASCTGFLIPTLDVHLANRLGLRPDVRRVPLSVGCVGGAAALARAHDLLAVEQNGRALVVAVELPSLNLQVDDTSMTNVVSTALFGDGAGAALLTTEPVNDTGVPYPAGVARLEVLGTLAWLIPGTTGSLGFDLRDDGFHSVLGKEVPALVQAHMAAAVQRLTANAGVDRADVDFFVVHAGGRPILDGVATALALGRDALAPSWQVLRDFGNQSSASVLFVLDAWMRGSALAPGRHGVIAAFGPGLSLELLLVRGA